MTAGRAPAGRRTPSRRAGSGGAADGGAADGGAGDGGAGDGGAAGGACAVVGAGTMGRGIAQLLAQAGYHVVLVDPSESALRAARERLGEVIAMLAGKGRLGEPAAAVLARLRFATDTAAVAGTTWVLEAAPEELDLKRAIAAEVGRVAPQARLATNTSTLSITAIAAASPHPERVIGLHFFNPAPLMALVEVVPGVHTAPEVVADAAALARALGRTPVLARDRPGFIVNRVARPFYGEALRLAGEGVPHATIDLAARSLGFPMGPFELLDLIGLDVNLAATRSVWEASFHEPRYRPHPLQQALVDAGRKGRKAGRGFYAYGEAAGGATSPSGPPSPLAAPARSDDAPAVAVLGDGAVGEHLRARLSVAARPNDAVLVLDTRVVLAAQRVPDALARVPLASLCWAHSASRARQHHGRELIGFSVVPGGSGEPTVELFAPEGGAPGAVEHAERVLAASGVATLTLPDRAGGVAFRLVSLLANEALSALEEGLAGADAIDTAMRLGTRYPTGPLAWAEALGLGELEQGLRGLHAETLAARFAPRPLLTRLAAVGAELPRGAAPPPRAEAAPTAPDTPATGSATPSEGALPDEGAPLDGGAPLDEGGASSGSAEDDTPKDRR